MGRDRLFIEVAGRLYQSMQRIIETGQVSDICSMLYTLQNEMHCIQVQLGIPKSLFDWAVIQKSRELSDEPLLSWKDKEANHATKEP